MKRPEILAPAGSMETLVAALRSGADAVYVGGRSFSARNSAVNFSDAELAEAVKLCHLYGAKLYLAVNTIVSDAELDKFCRYIKYAVSVGTDAFIVQDWGCAALIRKCAPKAVLHGSTQMSVHTKAGAVMLKKLGFSRVVPARELDKTALAEICSTGIEVETFVHGALCMSVSGQCYMSAMIGSRSANRGCCGQACRLPFSSVGDRSGAALSLKDLSLIPKVSELVSIGVDSLKIEGRMKRPEYTAATVHELRAALDGKAPNMQLLRGIFSRSGFTDGYFTGKRRDMFGVREKDDVTAAHDLIPKIHELYRFERSVRTVDFKVVIQEGRPVSVTAVCGDISANVTGSAPEKAQNRPTDIEMLKKQLGRLGDTVFTLGEVSAKIGEGLIVPSGRLNELRREVISRLSELIVEDNMPDAVISDFMPVISERTEQPPVSRMPMRVWCRTAGQISAAADRCEYIIAPIELINGDVLRLADKLIIAPPRFVTDEKKLSDDLSRLKKLGVCRLLCHTPDTIMIGKKLGFILHGSFTLNIFNSYSTAAMKELGLEDCLISFEATLSQIAAVRSKIPLGAVVGGRLPLMLTRNCPIKNEVGCAECTSQISDRTGRSFPVMCSREYVEILNADPLFMLDRLGVMRGISFGVIMLSSEDEEQTKALLSGKKPKTHITRGLYYRGINAAEAI